MVMSTAPLISHMLEMALAALLTTHRKVSCSVADTMLLIASLISRLRRAEEPASFCNWLLAIVCNRA